MSDKTAQTSIPNQTLVLLGASNLSLAWPRIMSALYSGLSGQSHIYTAHGMGRSYIYPDSACGFRKLPGILCSGIWDALLITINENQSFALITDLGNDLLYGSNAVEVAQSAEESIRRLRAWSPECRIVMTRPPVESVRKLGWLRFFVARTILFPLTRLTLTATQTETLKLDQLLVDIADHLEVSLIKPDPVWYGVDPIHVRWRSQHAAFSQILAEWFDTSDNATTKQRLPATLTKRPLAELRWLCGLEKRTCQPAIAARDVSIFAY